MSVLWGYVSVWLILAAFVVYVVLALFVQRAIRVIPRQPEHALLTTSMIPELREEEAEWRQQASMPRVQRCSLFFLLIPRMLYRILGVPKHELDETAQWAARARRLDC